MCGGRHSPSPPSQGPNSQASLLLLDSSGHYVGGEEPAAHAFPSKANASPLLPSARFPPCSRLPSAAPHQAQTGSPATPQLRVCGSPFSAQAGLLTTPGAWTPALASPHSPARRVSPGGAACSGFPARPAPSPHAARWLRRLWLAGRRLNGGGGPVKQPPDSEGTPRPKKQRKPPRTVNPVLLRITPTREGSGGYSPPSLAPNPLLS